MKAFLGILLVCFIVQPAWAQQTGWIGVSVEDGKDQGVSIRSVESDSPAAKAGLKAGDLIIEYNKTPVLGSVQFSRLVRETPAGRTVDVKVHRDNRDQTLQLTPGTGRERVWLRSAPDVALDGIFRGLDSRRFDMPRVQMSTSYTRAGIRVDSMTSQLREFFGVTGNNGVLVASVESGSAAEKAGIKAGDVITAVGSQTVRTPAEFDREMRGGAGKLSLRVVRDRQEREITVERSSNTR